MLKRLKCPFTVTTDPSDPAQLVLTGEGDWSVLNTLFANEVEISSSCGGSGSCGTCRIEIISWPGAVEPRGEVEAEMADARGFEEHERLACQISAVSGLKIRVP